MEMPLILLMTVSTCLKNDISAFNTRITNFEEEFSKFVDSTINREGSLRGYVDEHFKSLERWTRESFNKIEADVITCFKRRVEN